MTEESKALYRKYRDTERDLRSFADTLRLIEALPFAFEDGHGRYSERRLQYVKKRIGKLKSDELQGILLSRIREYDATT